MCVDEDVDSLRLPLCLALPLTQACLLTTVQTMYKGVVRDAERRAEKLARAKELEEQAIRRAYLEQSQPVSRPSAPAPDLPPGIRPGHISSSDVRFDACKTC